MSKKKLQENTTSQSQVFDLLGRALYTCNVIELQLRWMHKHVGGIWTGKTPEELLKSLKKAVEKQQKDDKRPLCPIGLDLIDAIYTPRNNKDFKTAKKQQLGVLKIDYKIQCKGRLLQATEKFKKFIETRNYLVHYFARDYNLAEPESRTKAYDDLKKKSKVIKDAAEFFNEDYNLMNRTIQDFLAKLPESIKVLSNKNSKCQIIS